MKEIVFFLEEQSAKEMLLGVLPKILPDSVHRKFVTCEGKQHLDKSLPIKLRAWNNPNTQFVVIRDQDHGDCTKIKNDLLAECKKANKPNVLIRIACHELESFYLGDLSAVSKSIGPNNLGKLQNQAKYRNPDRLSNPLQELTKLAPSYQKILGSRKISPNLNIDNNRSDSFRALISGVRRLASQQE